MVRYNQKETRKENKKMMDDFMMEVGCEEVYGEDGYHGQEPAPAEWEPF